MSGIMYQVMGALILNIDCFVFGLATGVPSTTMLLFTSKDTILNRPMTLMESSLQASLACIGGFLCNPATGFLLDRLGRKKCVIIPAVIGTLSWAMMAFSNQVEVILAALFMQGFAGSVFLVVPLYVSEFTQDSIRGTLASGAVVFCGIGMLTMFILGEFLKFKTITYIGLTMSVISVALLSILKESPTLLMKKGLEEEAAKSMGFYRNAKPNSNIVIQEIEKIKRALSPEPQEMSPEQEKLTAEFGEPTKEKLSTWQFFKNSRSTQRALIITLTIMTCAVFQGMVIIQIFAIPLFSEAVPPNVLSPNWCSAILSTVAVVVGLIAGYLTDVAGRRTLLMYSCFSAGICALALGTQIHLHWAPQWATAVFIYLFCIAYTFGSGTVPFLLMAEMFLPEVRSLMSMLCVEWNWVTSFFSLFLFNPLVSVLGLGPMFYFFSSVAFFASIFTYFFVPETKGLSVDAIQVLLVKNVRVPLNG